MNRRGFFGALAGLVATWHAPKPHRPILISSDVANALADDWSAMLHLQHQHMLAVTRYYDEQFIGDTVAARLPVRFTQSERIV